ncbi:MAG: hypothetical protein JNJ95_07065 [Dechloromonas sp.]|nr:hypothetical protein [Dechloromonas sp.]
MATRYTCFVISPIGDPDSPVRLAADETFEYIIKPALDKYDFVVERADHIRGIQDTITQEVVERIQRSDLCIVDLSGINPNVMYECGRRHENGKPCILISRDAKLPFDVVTHPVIRYSVEANAREVIDTIRVIQQNVQTFVDLGFERAGNRTVSDVYREVGVLGQKLDLLLKRFTSQGSGIDVAVNANGNKANEASKLIKKLGGVAPAISFALSNRDTELLDQLLPKFPNKRSENFVVGGLAQGAAIGSRVAFEMIEEIVTSNMDEFSWNARSKIIGGYAAGASRFDEEARALPIVESAIQQMRRQLDQGESIETEQQTMILNALQRTYHGLGQYENAITIGAEVLRLAPYDESFLFNQSLNFHKANQPAGAIECVDMLVATMRENDFAEVDDDHLAHCIAVLVESGRIAEARELFLVLDSQHPYRAQILRNDDDFEVLFS